MADARHAHPGGVAAPAAATDTSDKREQILQTAQELFAEQGFRETNLNDVAERLGFRRQAVYHYFSSKDEILYELIGRARHTILHGAEWMFSTDLAPEVALAEVIRNHVRRLLSNVDLFRVQFAELGKLNGRRADGLRGQQADYVRKIAAIIAAGQKSGVFRVVPAIPHALLVLGMCNSTSEWYSDTRSHLTIDEVADYTAQLALSGVAAGRAP